MAEQELPYVYIVSDRGTTLAIQKKYPTHIAVLFTGIPVAARQAIGFLVNQLNDLLFLNASLTADAQRHQESHEKLMQGALQLLESEEQLQAALDELREKPPGG